MDLLEYFLFSLAEARHIKQPFIEMRASGRNVNINTIHTEMSIKLAIF